MSSLVITIDDTSDIVISATPGATALGLIAYIEPAILTSVTYGSGSPYLHGATALSSKREQTLHNWVVAPFLAADEAAAEALLDALRTSIERPSFNVSVARNGVTRVWACDPGSLTPAGGRTRLTLDRPHLTEWNVSIPCYPVPS